MSSQPNQPNQAEPMPVQLTRVEGTVNLIAYQIGDLVKRVDRHEVDITALKMAQASGDGASASWWKWASIFIGVAGVIAAFLAIKAT